MMNETTTKNKKLLKSFVDYCTAHPELRFWQALRAWSGAEAILYRQVTPKKEAGVGVFDLECRDTFYWNSKNK